MISALNVVDELNASLVKNGMTAKNNVIAGVGSPIKESVCLVSRLNLANLNNANTGIRKAIIGKYVSVNADRSMAKCSIV